MGPFCPFVVANAAAGLSFLPFDASLRRTRGFFLAEFIRDDLFVRFTTHHSKCCISKRVSIFAVGIAR